MRIKRIKYFHPSGRTELPSGHAIQKGGFVKECIENKNKFNDIDLLIVLPEGNKIRESLIPINYKKGNFFRGEFKDKNSGAIFGKDSLCLALNMNFSYRLLKKTYRLLKKMNVDIMIIKFKGEVYKLVLLKSIEISILTNSSIKNKGILIPIFYMFFSNYSKNSTSPVSIL